MGVSVRLKYLIKKKRIARKAKPKVVPAMINDQRDYFHFGYKIIPLVTLCSKSIQESCSE